MRVIDFGSLRVALVVNEEIDLVGTVTDGDNEDIIDVPLTSKVKEIV